MDTSRTADTIDVALLRELVAHPDATNLAISEATGLARNTVRARLSRYAAEESLHSFERRIDPAFLGFPLQAFIVTTVKQRKLSTVSDTLAEVPEVLQVHGLSGVADLLVHVAARDADDLYLGGRQFGPRFFPPARAEGVGRAPIPDECSASSSPGGLPT